MPKARIRPDPRTTLAALRHVAAIVMTAAMGHATARFSGLVLNHSTGQRIEQGTAPVGAGHLKRQDTSVPPPMEGDGFASHQVGLYPNLSASHSYHAWFTPCLYTSMHT